jgi:hypothetical protein
MQHFLIGDIIPFFLVLIGDIIPFFISHKDLGEIGGHNTIFISHKDFIVVSRCHFEGAQRLRNLSGFPIEVGNDRR